MNMVERVARALRRRWCIDAFDRESDIGWEGEINNARAAIAAMREPTEAMLDFGACHEDQDHEIFDEGHISREVWHAMIDAALMEDDNG